MQIATVWIWGVNSTIVLSTHVYVQVATFLICYILTQLLSQLTSMCKLQLRINEPLHTVNTFSTHVYVQVATFFFFYKFRYCILSTHVYVQVATQNSEKPMTAISLSTHVYVQVATFCKYFCTYFSSLNSRLCASCNQLMCKC